MINYYSLEGEVEDPYYLSVRIAIERRAAELGYRLVSISEKDEFRVSGMDGVICLGTFGTEELKRIDELERPTEFLWTAMPNYDKYDSIVFDLRRETRRILDYLWEKGHRRIGFIGGNDMEGPGTFAETDKRTLEYRAFMEE